ncbi:MAG: ABC transporter ATP-binding protein [Gammaproteobacteria bacterium]
MAAIAEQAARTPLLSLGGMSKSFGALQVLDDVSLDLAPGEVHCLLGENGAGKSTLCNLIFGVHAADAGEMRLLGERYTPSGPGDALARGIAMVHQHFSLVQNATVVDNLLLGQARGLLDRKGYAQRVRRLGEDFGLDLDPWRRVDELSVGERQRVEIVKCLMREPQLLVLDEPTAVLLPDEIDGLLGLCRRLAERGCAVLLVTHKLAEIKKVADRVSVLRGGRVVARSTDAVGDISALVRAMIHRDPGTLDRTVGAAVAVGAVESATPARTVARDLAAEVLQADGITVRDADGVTRLDTFSLVVNRGEIVGVAGVEGNGQSELAALLSGMLTPSAGRFFVAGRELTDATPERITATGVGVVPEDRHAVGCITAMSLAENLFLNRLGEFTRHGFLRRKALRSRARALMKTFDVRAAGPDVPFESLSGGNQQKAVLARELTLDNLVFLLAAQPTRGLDVGAVEAVYRHIRAACERGVGVLLISSELDELLAVCDRIVVLYRGRIMGSCRPHPGERERIGAMMAGHAP